MSSIYIYEGDEVRAIDAPGVRPLRWAAWRPDGAFALLAGNRGEAWRFDGRAFARLDTKSTHNLRAVAWSPDGARALLAGNRGAVLLHEGDRFRELASPTVENLRRAAWSPDGSCALIIGNAGVVLRFDAESGTLAPLPGDRAHTLRSIAWRPDGAYALIGAYASAFAGYPRPHALYRCDGRYTQALLATDDEDDAVAVSWRPGAQPPEALVLLTAQSQARAAVPLDQQRAGVPHATNKLVEYDGGGFMTRGIEAPGALLGAAWRPDGALALLCGERGTLLRYEGGRIDVIASRVRENLVGPFWHPAGESAILLRGPDEKVYTV
jgi:hypothetical protein